VRLRRPDHLPAKGLKPMAAMERQEACKCGPDIPAGTGNTHLKVKLALLALALVAWWLIYRQLEGLANWLTYGFMGLARGSHLGEALAFFLYDIPKIFLLLVLVVFGVGLIRSFFTPERTRAILAGKRETLGDVMAALLGVVTPFCSCSAVPLFLGFVEAGIPIGVTFSFLISAPMVNEIALVLLWGLFGWKIALLYMSTGLIIAMVTGFIIGRLDMERQVQDWVYEIRMGNNAAALQKLTWSGRFDYAWQAVKDIIGKVWLYIIAGIAVGAAIHGYVPEGVMAAVMGKKTWWSVPVAVLVGAPIYSNAAGIIPVVQALMEKGASLGTVLAFMMSVIGISLPEILILRRVLKPRLIAVFVGVVTVGIMIVGFLFNAIL
jgi:uncharacterized membrane protein YraQ (UPF0718 family)